MKLHPSFNPGFGYAIVTDKSGLPIAWFLCEAEALEWKRLNRGNYVPLVIAPCHPIQSPSSANAASSTTTVNDTQPSSLKQNQTDSQSRGTSPIY